MTNNKPPNNKPPNNKPPKDLQPWIEAKKKHRLSQKHIQMARELGMNPKGFGKLDNHKQQPWKAPLPQFIENLYMKRFGKEAPAIVLSFEQISKQKAQKKEAAKQQKALQNASDAAPEAPCSSAQGIVPQSVETTH